MLALSPLRTRQNVKAGVYISVCPTRISALYKLRFVHFEKPSPWYVPQNGPRTAEGDVERRKCIKINANTAVRGTITGKVDSFGQDQQNKARVINVGPIPRSQYWPDVNFAQALFRKCVCDLQASINPLSESGNVALQPKLC